MEENDAPYIGNRLYTLLHFERQVWYFGLSVTFGLRDIKGCYWSHLISKNFENINIKAANHFENWPDCCWFGCWFPWTKSRTNNSQFKFGRRLKMNQLLVINILWQMFLSPLTTVVVKMTIYSTWKTMLNQTFWKPNTQPFISSL